ncbi:MAG: GAF domain-containing protein [Ignavibacteriae bacterium]|nr:MAG: GAF domain-containing protein [Ignavibacteriota bacterium]
MKEKFSKIISYFVRGLGIFLLIFVILAFAHSLGYITVANRFGILGFDEEWIPGSDSLQVVTSVSNEYSPARHGIVPGDTITRINNLKLKREDFDFNNYYGEPLLGKKAQVTILKNGIPKTFELEFVPAPFYDKFLEVLFRMIPAILMLSYVLVGFWGLIKSPYSRETILIALFCFCFGSFMYSSISFSVKVDTFVSKYLYFYNLFSIMAFVAIFASSFWLFLFVSFPKPFPFYQKNKLISYIFIFLLPIIVALSAIFNLSINPFVVVALIFINMTAGVLLLGYNTKQATTALEQRQIKLMSTGIRYGAIAIGMGWIIIFAVQFLMPGQLTLRYITFTIFLLGEIAGLIIPFTFLNSFFQNKLLETQTALKKRIRYIGGTMALLSLYLFLIFIVVQTWINIFNITDPTLIIIFVLLVSLTFTPLNKRLLRWLDEKFYPERTKYTESLKQFIHNISGYIESSDLLDDLALWIKKTTGIHPIIPVAFAANGNSPDIPFYRNEQNSVLQRIKDGDKFFWDEVTERSRLNVNEKEFEWARSNDISVTLPMISRGELIGVLNVGKKHNAEDYTAEDLDILTQASNQAAIALQNMNLQSEYIHKKRMDKELEMARKIQKQLMPQEIPHVKGLELVGECRPCNEIAGDYFDIINMDDGNTAIVVADVSGKGAGAAMIMANLQASIRLGIHLSDKLNDFVSRVNDLIYKNTSPYEFITFFMAIWVPAERMLYYVNAGHNPPVVVDKDNNVTQLHATGLILGVLPDQKYEWRTAKVEENDVLLIYTDGLEEALNNRNEFFGQERIIETVIHSKNRSSAEISSALIYEVLRFCNGTPIHDDVTMIVAKGVESSESS